MNVVLKLAENGQLNLPSHMRKLVGLERGGPVSVWVEDGEIHVRAVSDVMAGLQAEAGRILAANGETVDDFLADRRAEAAQEKKSERS